MNRIFFFLMIFSLAVNGQKVKMNFSAEFIEYKQTGYFSQMVRDYIAADEGLRPFYKHPVSVDGIKEAIEERKQFNTDRKLLVNVLRDQYKNIVLTQRQEYNIQQLNNANTFTVCTAHQPNIFTGYLYFIYKIVHAIKLSEYLTTQITGSHFIPVYYMGSEDADLEELGQVWVAGEKLEWKTNQTGAVGRMKVDKALIKMIEMISGQISIYPHGDEIVGLIKDCYKEGVTIELATFKVVNALFDEYGLLILLPDNAALKKAFIPVMEKELAEKFSHIAVEETALQLSKKYKVKTSGRELNLFYLKDNSRERIVAENSKFKIHSANGGTTSDFDKAEITEELHQFPERFSPNVVLRPVFQEMVLPNIAFIGGGGEIEYWLQLKKVFEAVHVPYPVMFLRNSFMVISKELKLIAEKLQLNDSDLFRSEFDLLNELVKKKTTIQVDLEKEKLHLFAFYEEIKKIPGAIDGSLQQHTEALQAAALKKLEALEKKMLKAEKKKFEAQQRQLHKLKTILFPNNSLQERVDNFMPYAAKWGQGFIAQLYKNSLSLEQKFIVLTELL